MINQRDSYINSEMFGTVLNGHRNRTRKPKFVNGHRNRKPKNEV